MASVGARSGPNVPRSALAATLVVACGRPAPDERWVLEVRGVPIGVESRWLSAEPGGGVRVDRELDLAWRAGTVSTSETLVRTDSVAAGEAPPPWTSGPDVAWVPLAPGDAAPPPGDVLGALVQPTARFEGARTAREAVFTVDGRRAVVDVPLRLEIPAAARASLDEWTTEVAAALRYVPDGARTSPAEAIARGTGDCTERADLLVDRAIAAGLPARSVRGWVYLDGGLGPGLYPHAWTEVQVDGRWIPVDPTLLQVPADATHLPDPAGTADVPLSASVSLVEIR